MAIVANKHPHAYAAVCETPYAAEKSRSINNAKVPTLGGFIITPQMALTIVTRGLKPTLLRDAKSLARNGCTMQ